MRVGQLLEAVFQRFDLAGQGIVRGDIFGSVALPAPLPTSFKLFRLLRDHSETSELLVLVVRVRRHDLVALRQEQVVLLLPPTGGQNVLLILRGHEDRADRLRLEGLTSALVLLLLIQLLLREVVVLVPVKLPPQYLIQEYLLLIAGLHIICEVDLAAAPGSQVREHPLLPKGVISATSSLGEKGAVHHLVHRTLAS